MIPMLLSTVVQESGGTYVGDPALLSLSVADIKIDSRAIAPGDLYVPVMGARFDGHTFIPEAQKSGALCVFSEHPLECGPYILVPDAVMAMQNVAAYYRALFPIPLIGITGSMGKTSVKEMVAAALSVSYNVHKSLGNKNNQTGLPLMLFQMNPTHEISVMELGTNHFGEVRNLARMTRPDICLFTNIGVSHIENFGSREGILKGKMEMLEYKKPGGRVIVNGDDDMLCRIESAMTFGFHADNDVTAEQIEDLGLAGMSFTARSGGERIRICIPAPGRTAVLNALAAVAVGQALGMPLAKIKEGLESYVVPAGRMHIERCGRMTLIDDSYNSNPTSVMAAVDVLEGVAGRRVAILGDMLELGPDTDTFHEDIGAYCAAHGVDVILCVGKHAERTYYGAQRVAPERVRYFETQDALIDALPALLRMDDTVLVKASRGMFLENTAKFLRTYCQNAAPNDN